MPKKIDIVQGAYKLIRISGLTSEAIPEEIEIGLQSADDLAGQLSTHLNLGYVQPSEYGTSSPDDYSGLTFQTAGPFKKLLAIEIVDYFGKVVPPSLQRNADKGVRSLEQLLVNVAPMQNPATLPIGSGNGWDYRSDKFYPEPTNDDGAEDKYLTDVFQLDVDWSQWLRGEDSIASVDEEAAWDDIPDSWDGESTIYYISYEHDAGINVTNELLTDNKSTSTVSFSRTGQFTLCVTATSSKGNVKTEKFIYNVTKCINNYYP